LNFLAKVVASSWQPIFYDHQKFFTATFVKSGRDHGHLATLLLPDLPKNLPLLWLKKSIPALKIPLGFCF